MRLQPINEKTIVYKKKISISGVKYSYQVSGNDFPSLPGKIFE